MTETAPLPAVPEVTDRQRQVIVALVAGASVTDAAKKCGVARRTVNYWLNDPGFQIALDDRRREVAARIADDLTELAALAVATLKRALAPPPDRKGNDMSWRYDTEVPFRVNLAKELVIEMGLLRALRSASDRPAPKG